MKAGAFFAGRGSQGNSWSWDFRRGGAEMQLRAGRSVRDVKTGDTGTIDVHDASEERCIVRFADGAYDWIADRDLEVVP